jgi:VIT1/CCC1 family predicted Fe2+/Mn2+ transporter
MSEANATQPAYVAPSSGARTNTLAIVSLVTSIIGLGIVGIITGHISLNQIKKTHEQGHGLALAGLIIGYISVAAMLIFGVIFLITAVVVGSAGYTTY